MGVAGCPAEHLGESKIEIPPFEKRECLRPHQIEGVKFMYKSVVSSDSRGCVLGDAMGLG